MPCAFRSPSPSSSSCCFASRKPPRKASKVRSPSPDWSAPISCTAGASIACSNPKPPLSSIRLNWRSNGTETGTGHPCADHDDDADQPRNNGPGGAAIGVEPPLDLDGGTGADRKDRGRVTPVSSF